MCTTPSKGWIVDVLISILEDILFYKNRKGEAAMRPLESLTTSARSTW